MQVRPYVPLAVAALAAATIPFHHREARPLDQAAVVSYPQPSSTPVDSGDVLDLAHAKIRASRSLQRVPVKPKPKPKPAPQVVHTYVHPSVSRETHVARPHTTYSGSASAWAHQYFSVRVANCESGGGPSDHHTYYDGNPHLSDPNGHYGKWQFAPSTWYSVGGTGNAAYASEAEQDYRAWLLWKRDGWGQWECASMV